jgi:hypothetical protein
MTGAARTWEDGLARKLARTPRKASPRADLC